MARQLGLAPPVFSEAQGNAKAKLLMAIVFAMNWDLNISIPIRWLCPWNNCAGGDNRTPQGAKMKPLLDVLVILDALERGELCRRLGEAL